MKTSPGLAKSALQLLGAVAMAVLLVGFILVTRFLDRPARPDQEIRTVETLHEVASPPPTPPTFEPETETAPPPPPVELPQLDLQIDTSIPALTATTQPKLDFTMETSQFSTITTPVPAPVVAVQKSSPKPTRTRAVAKPSPPKPKPAPTRSTYSTGELDSKPSLVNRPSVSYPSSMKRQGNPTGKVLLEVVISTSGRVTVKRVIGSNHSDFTSAAKFFAARARFSVPRKDGRPVTAIYKWPIILKP